MPRIVESMAAADIIPTRPRGAARARARGRAQAGFTLLEALVVVAVTALIGGVLFPNMQRLLGALEVRQTAAVTEASLRVARGEALRTGRAVSFAVRADGKGFAWTGGPAYAAGRGVLLAAAPERPIVFYGDGSSSGGELSVGGAGRRVLLAVDPATGGIAPR